MSLIKNNRGATLLEILISLLVLSIGMLGISGLQTVGLRNSHSAYLRTQATLLTFDILERIRANRQGIDANSYNNVAGALTANCLTVTGCTSSQLAAHDMAEWQASIAATLPSGSGTVCIDSDPSNGSAAAALCDGLGNIYAVTLWWDDDRDGNATQKYVMAFQP